MGRPRIAEKSSVISIRLPVELIALLDQFSDTLREQMPGLNITRTDAARAILTEYLTARQPQKNKHRSSK